MEIWDGEVSRDGYVEAIADGKIVKVSEEYAKLEGLPILRRPALSFDRKETEQSAKQREQEKEKVGLEDLRKELNWSRNEVVKTLIDNFHWLILKRRRELGLTRRQFSVGSGVKESDLKMMENGKVPRDDFVLINRVEEFLGVNLRKTGEQFGEMRKLVEGKGEDRKEKRKIEKELSDSLVGDDIDLME
tara:strand:+ start:4595 stop:5161 length:567 start_codon:yes stop_codon:yes gene_type:complete